MDHMIPLHRPIYENIEQDYVESAMANRAGQTSFCALAGGWLKERTGTNTLMTTSCTTALDLAAVLLHGKPGDEVILPSFTFSSTANAFIKRGMMPVFVDIRRDTMNLDENKIEAAITDRTVAVVPMHYAGVGCEMDTILSIAGEHGLAVVEDAAQALMSTYKGKPLGSFGDFGCISFHETKNFSMGEGGCLLINKEASLEEAETYAECGTSRSKFRRGEVAEYTWMSEGDSCAPSELACMFLYPQLLQAEKITEDRIKTWNFYEEQFRELSQAERMILPTVPPGCVHNGHIFYIRVADRRERDKLLAFLREQGIMAAFHYVPLHTSLAGKKYGRFHGRDEVTTKESERLLRLPLYYGMKQEEKEQVVETVRAWFRK